MNKNIHLINVDTGEFIEDGYSIRFHAQDKAWAKIKNSKNIRQKYGNFIWLLYNRDETLFPTLKPSTVTRLIYLSTFMNYEGFLAFSERKKTVIKKIDLAELLNLSRNETHVFIKSIIDNKIIYIKDDKIFLNPTIFHRGEIKSVENDFVRMYINGIRDLYRISTATNHKRLGYLFQLIPYVNLHYNIICKNPLESDLDKIEIMTTVDICEILNMDTSHAKRLSTQLAKIMVGSESAITLTSTIDKKTLNIKYCVLVNPKIYFGGKDYSKVELIGKFHE